MLLLHLAVKSCFQTGQDVSLLSNLLHVTQSLMLLHSAQNVTLSAFLLITVHLLIVVSFLYKHIGCKLDNFP